VSLGSIAAAGRALLDGFPAPFEKDTKRMSAEPENLRLLRPIDLGRDHIRGGRGATRKITMVLYGDYLCPYCRRLREVLERLRHALSDRLAYAYRHFPNERAHPGAELLALGAEAAARQDRFWEMHDALYQREPPLDRTVLMEIAASLGLEMVRFERDLQDPKLRERIEEDLADGRRNGVGATPTIFVDGLRYDGAWDFYSMLESLERPVGAQFKRTARAFANLPSSAGLVLLLATAVALICANSPLATAYRQLMSAQVGIGPTPGLLSLSVQEWCSEGLLAIFFLIVGLEIRREMTSGSLADWRAATAPLLAAVGGVIVPAGIYLALNPPATRGGWSVPTDTGLAFTLGVLALFGSRASAGLKAFVATYAVACDVLVILILAVFYPRAVHAGWLLASAAALAVMVVFNRWRIYVTWPYLAASLGLWLSLHLAGVSGAISGIAFAALLPPRPAPAAGPLLAQAANALAELEHAEHELKGTGDERRRLEQQPVWDWASRNLSAAAERLLSPAERVEQAAAPWSTYVVLPLFAFTAAGVSVVVNFDMPYASRVFSGTALGLVLGKPLGMVLATWVAAKARIGLFPAGAAPGAFLGATFLCGIGDPLSFLVAEQAFFSTAYATVAKIGVLSGSALAAVLGALTLTLSPAPVTEASARRERAA
jgi:Na+:H+ antiporter, NhaA family